MRTLTRWLSGIALSLVSVTGLLVSTAPAAEAVSTPCIQQNFSYSLTKKPCVTHLQTMLNAVFAEDYASSDSRLGAKRHLVVDGKYGTETQKAVTRLEQSAYGYTWSGKYVLFSVEGATGKQVWAFVCWWEMGKSAANKAGCVEGDLYFKAVGLTETPHN
jgi:peptidoglycan hydrolase-like protein with peptidoglycan-binding domain